MFETHLFARSTAHHAVLYWDKPAAAGAQAEYTVYLNNEPVGTATRTHYTLSGLEPQTEYRVDVVFDNQPVGACMLRTGAEKQRINVTEAPYWVKGDGVTKNTAALQRAIDACGPGDAVYLPAGTYLTGALRLHSDMELYLDEGAVLQGTAEIVDYQPRIPSRFEGIEQRCYSSLLNLGKMDHADGYNCVNVVIRGKGTIASGGKALADKIVADERERLKDYLAEHADLVASCDSEDTIPGRVRPRLINISNSQNVWISGLTLRDGASWNVHMIYSDNIVTDHCVFQSQGVWNGDGWDPDSSTNCTLFGCDFQTGDDAVAIKSGKNPEGNVIARPSAHIYVFDCHSTFGHGICIGSEMSGGVEDVQIWDCDLTNAFSGIEIKATAKRGGYVRGVTVRDCKAPRVMIHGVPYNDDGEAADTVPVLEHFTFAGLTLTGRALNSRQEWKDVAPVELVGFEGPDHALRDVNFDGLTITAKAPRLPLQSCCDVTLRGLTCLPPQEE
ncbi:glycoside hydrolase family 28 protein [uncultured Subdoligranulum sp.]|uniref:glycoside hydrolase family 28 protein n=1 Tax=uncultured Subdoligranulum sp. TaxID=512298 RepID=UPI0025D43B51|nr:glycoside hydrolase family 28 protein [uncultured Subdoligranulum sp.]